MEYTTFGKTGRKVSRLGFGGAAAGLKNYLEDYDPAEEASVKNVVEAIHKALELGITFFDTAPGYGERKSERMFGEGLQGVKPEDIFLATKISYRTTKEDMYKSAEESLKCLRRDYVDLIQFHGTSYTKEDTDRILGPGGLLEALEDLKRQGLTKYIGFTSEDNNDSLYRLIQSGRFDSVHTCYNFIFQHGYEGTRPFGSLLEAEKYGLGTITMRAPTSGMFQKWIQKVNPANTFNYTPALIQFVLSNPHVNTALVGMRTKEQVIENVKTACDLQGRIDMDDFHRKYP